MPNTGEKNVEKAEKENLRQANNDLEARLQAERDDFEARQDRTRAMASVPQKVTDGNETAALGTISGRKPVRDMSEAPPPEPLGPVSGAADADENE